MNKTQAKIQSMSTAEWHTYNQLLSNRRLMDYFADEILRFAHSQLKPDDVLRRFSLNGDGQLDLKEFQLAVKRLGLVHSSSSDEGDAAHARKSKELFSVFCPSNNRKLDIDMFCRILNEWSLQFMRTQHHDPSNQQKQTQGQPVAPIPTPYAIETAAQASAGVGGAIGISSHSEGEVIWRRIRDAVVQQLDKLRQIFSKMDIACSACVSHDEFALALSHVGVFLTPREYDKLYEALPVELKQFDATTSVFSIRYADFLATIQQRQAAPPTAQTSSPPIATNARLWDLLVLALDKLEPLIQQYERAYQRYVTAETFRDLLTRCGITLSNPDFAALRVRLLPFAYVMFCFSQWIKWREGAKANLVTRDANGAIGLSALLHALKAHDHTTMASSVRSSKFTNGFSPTTMPGSTGMATISPIRTGRKTVFPPTNELSVPASLYSSPASLPVPHHAAGKTNEQRNSEANRSMIKVRDESRWNSNISFHKPSGDTPPPQYRDVHVEPETDTSTVKPLALERKILTKMQQLKEVGQLGSASPQSIFPGDRFGRITRGELRQSLVHLGLVARYAEVESLFWTLDPSGRGYMAIQDFYNHLNMAASKFAAIPVSESSRERTNWSLPALSPTNNTSSGLSRSVQKIFEAMLHQFPALLAICQRYDVHRTGLVSRGELTATIHELGVLASPQDVQTAIVAMTQRVELLSRSPRAQPSPAPLADPYHPNGIVYSKLEDRLKQLCSDLLSPKRRRQHLSTASVLLAPQETQHFTAGCHADTEPNFNMATETDALWNCPRRKMNQGHPATKSSIQITDEVYADVTPRRTSGERATNESFPRSLPRGRRLTVIAILQDLLEHRTELKSVVDFHRNADVHGQVTKSDLIEIFLASRLSLNFSNASPSGITAKDFVDLLYPQSDPLAVSFLELLHRISDLLNELSLTTPSGASATATGLYSNNVYHRDIARRTHTSSGHPSTSSSSSKLGLSYSPITIDPARPLPRTSTESSRTQRTLSLFASDELSLQRKLLYESRLRDLLTSDKGRQSAAILIRHAFKGVMARELVVPIDNGEFEAVCRASDLKHVCYRLGLDLDVGELQFLVSSIDVNRSGYVASPQLLQFFSHLAMRAGHTGAGSADAPSPREASQVY
jgi:Ca2+-binding EF-hand superfamily protein